MNKETEKAKEMHWGTYCRIHKTCTRDAICSVACPEGGVGYTSDIKIPNPNCIQTAAECLICGKLVELGYSSSIWVLVCDECKEAVEYAKKLLKEQKQNG